MVTQPDARRLLLVSPPAHVARKAAELGIALWSLADPQRTPAEELRTLVECSESLVTVDEGDQAMLLRQVREIARLHAITELWCLGDAIPMPVHELAWQLGLNPNPPQSIRALTAATDSPESRATSGAANVPESPAISVETFSIDGIHHIVGMTARRATGHVHPAPLTASDREEAGRRALEVLTSAGFRAGPAHVRLGRTDGTWQFAGGRVGVAPDRIPLLVQLTRGIDLEEGLLTARTGSLLPAPAATCYSEIGFFRLSPGRLRTVAGIDSICALPYISAVHFPFAPGDEVPPNTGHGPGHGYVVVVGDTPEATAHHTRTALRLLHTDTQPSSS